MAINILSRHSGLTSLIRPSKSYLSNHPDLLLRACSAMPITVEEGVNPETLNEYLHEHYSTTFLMRVSNSVMKQSGIEEGDLLVIDRTAVASHGCIVVLELNGELLLRKLLFAAKGYVLHTGEVGYPDLYLTQDSQFVIRGVVSWRLAKECELFN